MAIFLRFPESGYRPVRVSKKQKHRIAIWIVDLDAPEETRWMAQRPVCRAGSFKALAGFDDKSARGRKKHVFQVNGPRLLRRFLREIQPLVRQERVAIAVDRERVRIDLELAA